MSRSKLRVGIVGRRGEVFADAVRANASADLTALCDSDPQVLSVLSERLGVTKTYTKFEDMLGAVDAVLIATPMQLHGAQSIAALSAGLHVLSEVTAAVDLFTCWQLLDAVKASGKTYMMAENYCYGRDVSLVGELVRKGLFGEPYFAEGEYLHEVRRMHHTADGRPTWRYYWQVGVNGSTYPTHSLGPPMQWFTGVNPSDRIESVVCMGSGRHTDPEHPHDDTTIMLCKLESGKLIKVRVDMMSNRPHNPAYYTLQGTNGVFESSRVAAERGRIWFGKNQPSDSREWQPIAAYDEHLPARWKRRTEDAALAGHGAGDYFVIADFLDAVITGEPPPIDINSALEWTAAGLCSQESIRSGGVPIRLPNFRDPSQRPIILDAARG